MDKETRNRIQRATQAARSLLEQEYAEQLEGVFDIRLDGTIADEPGVHLDGSQKVQRTKLVTAVEHLRGAGNSKADAVAAYLREAAFTTLNRLVALKMLEARELVQECVSRGEQSAGFKEFTGLAPGLVQLPDHGYRAYIECIFDELSTEVKVLFERRDARALLWPKRATLDALLDLLNAADLSDVWAEDETIGWVYQFFNGDDERKQMRDPKRGGSQAPRNSREMAVRNQFFTPRYVVQFLTDNTLGRIWYEMRQGETVLRAQCEYMVRKPNEVFLRTSGPFAEEWLQRFIDGDLSAIPETFDWAQSVKFAHLIDGYRLSPLLGFGDVADLANAALRNPGARGNETAIEKWLRLFFEHRRSRHSGIEPSGAERERLDELCRELRALLAQPSENVRPLELVKLRQAKDPRDLRVLDPACGSGHFLLYAFDLLLPMYEEAYADTKSPASEATGRTLAQDYSTLEELRKAVPSLILAHNLHGVDIDARCVQIAQLALWMRAQRAYRDLGFARGERVPIRKSNIVVAEPLVADEQLVAEFVAKVSDAELGRVFTDLVNTLKLAGDMGLLLRVETLVARLPNKGTTGNLFAPPEERIRATLARFVATESERSNTRKRLFLEDATQGVGLLAIAEKKYDAVLMNPPFGAGSTRAKKDFERAYPKTKNDVYAAFVERGIELLSSRGRVGAITSRTGFFLKSYKKWREEVLLGRAHPVVVADLGLGVMDAAMVEAAAYCLEKGEPNDQSITLFLRVLEELTDKEGGLRRVLNVDDTPDRFRFVVRSSDFFSIPGAPFAYWVSNSVRALFKLRPALEAEGREARLGAHGSQDERLIRCWWEPRIEEHGFGAWVAFAKGGAFSRFYSDIHLLVDWESRRRTFLGFFGRPGRDIERPESVENYFRAGLTWSRRTKSDLSVRVLPAGCVFGDKGPGAFVPADNVETLMWLLAITNSAAFRGLVELQVAAADAKKGGAARSYEVGVIQTTPVPGTLERRGVVGKLARRAWSRKRLLDTTNETSHAFVLPPGSLGYEASSLHPKAGGFNRAGVVRELAEIQAEIDEEVFSLYGIDDEDRSAIEAPTASGANIPSADDDDRESTDDKDSSDEEEEEEETPAEISATPLTTYSWLVGVAFGRFDLRLATGERAIPPEPEPFDPLPARSPGMWPEGDVPPHVPPEIMVDDPGHNEDIRTHVASAAAKTGWPDPEDLRQWLAREFFPLHIKMYSKSRRKAPIYWQLATPSASYSVWLYIHAFTKDTLFRVQNEYVAPKLAHEQRKLESLQAGAQGGATAVERKELVNQETLVEELRAFLDEVKRVAPLWNPNLDDGVIINFSLLWRLVPQHKPWQKELKATWDALADGKYDWAHFAMHLWPERVVPKCAKDRSFAIAHGLEEVFWVEGADGKWTARKTPTAPIAELVRIRTSPAVQDALKQLQNAPTAAAGGVKKKAARKTTRRSKSAPPSERGVTNSPPRGRI